MPVLKLKPLWLIIGYGMIAFVVYSSLTTSPVKAGFAISDKVLHITAYFGLMGWFIQIYHDKTSRFILAVCFTVMGIGLEFLQGMGGVRVFEFDDMLANALGVILAWVMVFTSFPEILSRLESVLVK